MGGYSPKQLAIGAVVAMAVCAILYIAASAFGIAIPSIFVNIVWILIIAFVVIAAIVFLFSLAKPGP